MNNSSLLLTSLYKDNVLIQYVSNRIIIEKCPSWAMYKNGLIKVCDPENNTILEKKTPIVQALEIVLPHLTDGVYILHLYYLPSPKSSYYSELNSLSGFPFQVLKGQASHLLAMPFDGNKHVFEHLSESFYNSYNSTIVPNNLFIPAEVRQLSQMIAKKAYSNYERILAVHDWVADNIFYDYDSLNDGSYRFAKIDALSILKTKRTVCCGYSALSVTLLRAIGVMALNLDCYALGVSSGNNAWSENTMKEPANHVLTFAYADDRWIMMDTTWDSNKQYRNGEYITQPYPVSHIYFDGTIAFFSYTHRFIL